MKDHYNFVAKYYDTLAKAVFGRDQKTSQEWLIERLPTSGNLLIIGGGTGYILPLIYKKAPELTITFLEASSRMIERARKFAPAKQNITFIHSDNWADESVEADYIYAAFVLDCFTEEEIIRGVTSIESRSKIPLQWFIADFDPEHFKSVSQRIRINLSIIFFKLWGHHKPEKLPRLFHVFANLGYKVLDSNRLKSKYIYSQILQRS